VSVVVTTRNRPAHIRRAVETILGCDYPAFELCVVDQSTDDATEAALASFRADPRLCYHRDMKRGYSRGHNVGIARTRHELIALTDDDCTVPPDWLRQMAAAFAVDANIGLVYGQVLAEPYDESAGHVPVCYLSAPALLRAPLERPWPRGIGACLGLRRACWQAVHGFDEFIGPGARFRSGGDIDIGIRVLQRGYFIFEAPSVRVTHHGFRPRPMVRRLFFNYWFGHGAILAKLVRTRRWALVGSLWRAWQMNRLFAGLLRSLLRGRRPHGTVRLWGYIRGFLAAVGQPVDTATLKWQARPKDRRSHQ
jgi:glycosyltransferase involved in cell wall biosynthesis